jgi:hypothetical protein
MVAIEGFKGSKVKLQKGNLVKAFFRESPILYAARGQGQVCA